MMDPLGAGGCTTRRPSRITPRNSLQRRARRRRTEVGTNGDGNPRFTFADDEDAAAADAAPAGSEEADPVEIEARIVSTHNHLEDEPWLPRARSSPSSA